jgi:ankyrin repeat protein
MTAAHTGMAEVVNLLLEHGASVNAKESSYGQTALMWAVAEGHAEVAQALIKHAADVHARSATGYTPFLLSARNAGLETPRLLLGAGADVNEAAPDGTTALVVATIRGHLALAKFLLEQGADVNAGPGFAPLHWAAGDYVGGVNGRMGLGDEDSDWTVFEGLKGQAKRDFIELLLASGANPNARAAVSPRAESAGRSVINTPPESQFGGTPFWLAAKAANVETMRLLLAHGADPSLTTNRKATPLMAAAGVGSGAGSNPVPESRALEAVKLCLELGNNIDVANVDGETALHGAAYRTPQPADNLIRFLVETGAKMNVKNTRGWTPLIIVEGLYFNGSYTFSPSAAELLRKLGADPTPEGSVERQVPTMNVGVLNR